MRGIIDPGFETRRILVLSWLEGSQHGRTLDQLVRAARRVVGWDLPGRKGREMVVWVVQSLIDEGLVAMTNLFVLTRKGREYFEDPSKWRIDWREERRGSEAFWKMVYGKVGGVLRRLRSKESRLKRSGSKGRARRRAR